MLTVTAVNQAKPKDKPYKMADEKGLYLFIQSTGSKLWRFDYRFNDKRKTLAIGAYPDLSLAEARNKRDKARNLLANEVDPTFPCRNKARGSISPGKHFFHAGIHFCPLTVFVLVF